MQLEQPAQQRLTTALNSKVTYFQNLDGLRIILAMMVFMQHSSLGVTLMDLNPFGPLDGIISFFSSGGLAVSFFFVLSGYLITYLLINEKIQNGAINIRKFYLRRILRIWPLYYATLIFTFFVYPVVKSWMGFPDGNPFHSLYQFLFLANFDSLLVDTSGLAQMAPMMISVNWSIAIEEQFYLAWPLLFWFSGARKFWIVLASGIAVSWYCRLMVFTPLENYYHSLAVLTDFGVGALFAYLTVFDKNFVDAVFRMKRIFLVAFYGALIMLLMFPESSIIPPSLSRLFWTLIFGFVIVEQNFAANSLFKVGKSRFLTSMGKYTYSIYLLHPIGIQVAIVSFATLKLNREANFANGFVYALISFLVTMALSFASYHWLERFFLKQRKKFAVLDSGSVAPEKNRTV